MDRLKLLQDRAFWLPLAGLALLSTPFMTIFGGSTTILGVPLLYIYVFAVWMALIVLGRACSHALQGAANPHAASDHDEGAVSPTPAAYSGGDEGPG